MAENIYSNIAPACGDGLHLYTVTYELMFPVILRYANLIMVWPNSQKVKNLNISLPVIDHIF